MWKQIDQYVDKHHIIESGDRILLGLSGGADSICLARYLLSLRDRGQISLAALHVNHELRGEESRGDEVFVRNFCLDHRIPLDVVRIDVALEARRLGCSLEEAGRTVRYRLLRECAGHRNCNKIAAAHHRGDQAETLLLHQIRGSGFRGLAGMKPLQNDLIRPLLALSRAEILSILCRLGQTFREDSSNRSLDYHRNYIRHRILPAMKEINSGAEDHLAGLAGRMAELEEYLDPLLDRAFRENVACCSPDCPGGSDSTEYGVRPEAVLIRESILDRHPFEQREVIRKALALIAGKEKDLGRVHYEILDKLLNNNVGKRNHLPEGVMAVRIRPGLLLVRKTEIHGSYLFDILKALELTGAEADGLIRLIKGTDSGESENEDGYEDTLPDFGPGSDPLHFQGNLVRAVLYCLEGNDPSALKTDCSICLDYDKIKGQLAFRHRKAGDYFICDHQGHRKLLKRYFIDERIPAAFRSSCILLTQGSRVLWIETGRISEDCRVSDKTRHMLVIELDIIRKQDR